jgi:hypothetical protein
VGDIEITPANLAILNTISKRKDDLGIIGKAFTQLVAYFNEMTNTALALADRNLAVFVSLTAKRMSWAMLLPAWYTATEGYP